MMLHARTPFPDKTTAVGDAMVVISRDVLQPMARHESASATPSSPHRQTFVAGAGVPRRRALCVSFSSLCALRPVLMHSKQTRG
jgi:hypothetical protein